MNRLVRAATLCSALFAAAALAFAGGAYETGRIVGSGITGMENRVVSPFSAIEVEGSGNVTLTQGLVQSVSVEADTNILPVVKTEVVGNVLHLGFKDGVRVRNITRLEFRITIPRVTGVTISGSGDVHGATTLRSDALALEVRGSGSIDADLDVGTLNASIGGSGDIAVKGRAHDAAAAIDGSGSIRARDLRSTTADVSISGSGGVTIYATDTIAIKLSGSGDVVYGGGAKATISSSGSGTIRQM